MSIRLSTQQIQTTGLNGLLDVQKAVSKTQEQIAANKRVLTPADDPVASSRILSLNQELAVNKQYTSNLETLRNRLQREEVALNGVNDLIMRAQELVTQSGNGALKQEQRAAIGTELSSIVEAMAQLMNTRDASGEFIFAGYQGKTEPFVKGDDGRYRFTGDEGQRNIQIAPATSVASSDSGKKIFVDVQSVANTVVAEASNSNRAQPPAIVGGEVILNEAAFAEFYPEDVIIEFRPLEEVQPPRLTYNVRQVSDGRVLSRNQPYVSGGQIEFGGAAVRVSGQPAVGDTFTVRSSNKQGLLSTLEGYAATLQKTGDTPVEKQLLTKQLANTIGNLSNAQLGVIETRSSIGARLSLVDATLANNADSELAIRETLSNLEDLDYAAAISQLTQQTFILEAAQASFARISRLSIFNYL